MKAPSNPYRVGFHVGWAVGLLLVAAAFYGFLPRRADMRGFDPAGVARFETGMWRNYYDRQYLPLLLRLYGLSRKEYHFSPWDSARLAWYAGRAAHRFQPTSSRADAGKALVSLERYYEVIREHGGETFDAKKAARLELEWWQQRREAVAPGHYGLVIAQVWQELYGVGGPDLENAAVARAAMMAYRDERRDGRMTPQDWEYIDASLVRAYWLLKSAVGPHVTRVRASRTCATLGASA